MNYPQPGKPFDISKVLSVGSYSVGVEEGNGPAQIAFSALATLLLPFTSPSAAGIHLPVNMPSFAFVVSLIIPANDRSLSKGDSGSAVPFARLSTIPELNTTADLASISLPITGFVLPIRPETVPPLSSLVSNYLAALPSTILIESSDTPSSPTDSFPIALPPTRVIFPGPPEKPRILQSVTIKDTRLGAGRSEKELAVSGTLIASFMLPKEISGGGNGKGGLNERLDVRRLWPDALVFDGLPPPGFSSSASSSLQRPSSWDANSTSSSSRTQTEARPVPPLPNPLPARAFARIRTPDWLVTHMLPNRIIGSGERWVTAKLVDAPLEVLPGREAEFQAFVRKVSVVFDDNLLWCSAFSMRGFRADSLRS